MKKREVKRFSLVLSILLLGAVMPRNAFADPQGRAREMLAELDAAEAKLVSSYGKDVFTRGLPLSEPRTIGQIWGECLDDVGYPRTLAERQLAARELTDGGMEDAAATALVLGVANKDAIDYLRAALRRMAQGQQLEDRPVPEAVDQEFKIPIDENAAGDAPVSDGEGHAYVPRRGDRVRWQFACRLEPPKPSQATQYRGCSEANLGYLIADAEKIPLIDNQGQVTFSGTRSTGDRMVYETPSGFCVPVFDALNSSSCVLDIHVQGRQH